VAALILWITLAERLARGKSAMARARGRRMSETEYLVARAEQELRAALTASDERAREVHRQLADAYTHRLREMRALEGMSEMKIRQRA